MALSKEPLNPAYNKLVKRQMKRYASLQRMRFSLRSELDTLKSYEKGLLLQIGDINVSLDALDHLLRRARTAVVLETAS
jgi:hypothetical protein